MMYDVLLIVNGIVCIGCVEFCFLFVQYFWDDLVMIGMYIGCDIS